MKIEKFTNNQPLVFAHIGDLHINSGKEQNYIDFLCIVAQLQMHCASKLDFVYIPGDIADHGLPVQYQLVATALKMLLAPVHIIPGDHDMEQGNLSSFYTFLQQDQIPKAFTCHNCRCIFIDTSGPGKGGPDFRVGNKQLSWLENELTSAHQRGETNVLFMHTYPDDLADEQEKETLNKLIEKYEVALVDMGHTHYNELSNDGRTIFAATRSTGQIEEGPVGYSLVSIDNGIVSWRFRQLQDPFPFVLITAPADYRLIRDKEQIVGRNIEIKAIVFTLQQIERASCQVNNNEKTAMQLDKKTNTWHAIVDLPEKELVTILVEAIDSNGWPGQHMIQVATDSYHFLQRLQNGSDAASIGSWPENHIFGTQLGPNRNAKPNH